MALRLWKLMRMMPLAALVATAACAGSTPGPEPAPAAGTAAERPDLSVTRWTERTELFAEFPALAVGEPSRFAIHLTRLDTFKALTAGHVEVLLRDAGGAAERFAVEAPSRPGIFGVTVTPTRAGARELVIVIRSPGLDDEHRVGPVQVFATAAAAGAAAADEEAVPGVSFLKEQQWTLDFGTVLVADRPVRAFARVPARIESRPGGEADVVAPIDGRVVGLADLAVGARVAAGQELLRLLPPVPVPGDLPELRRAKAEADAAFTLAARDRERAQRLVAAGAAPARRLDEATAAELQARARVEGAVARLAQYEQTREGRTPGGDEGAFILRAPIAGVITARDAALGTNVGRGAVLFHVADVAGVHVTGQVPEAEAAVLREVTEAEIEVPGHAGPEPLGRRISVGPSVDPATRTLAVTFAFDNRRAGLALGQAVMVSLLRDRGEAGPAVPSGAIVDDAGRPIVFVQRSGESFERRAVTIGASSGGWVRVLDGVTPGERVVSRGAHLIRLASLSTSVPAHGHVH